MNPSSPLLSRFALLSITAVLAACGGGGSADTDTTAPQAPTTPVTPVAPVTPAAPVAPVTPATPVTPVTPAPPVLTLANAQGFWRASPSATTSVSAVILPSGQAWVIDQTGSIVTAMAQGALSVSGNTFTGVGKHYSLPGGAVQDFGLSAVPGAITATATTAAAPTLVNTSTVGTSASTTLTWSYNKAYESAATQASVQGRWGGAQGSISLNWDIDAAGKLTGTSTTGCTYNGAITPNARPVAVLDVDIMENCAGALKSLSGIATLNAAKTGLSVIYTTAAGAQGGVVALQLQR